MPTASVAFAHPYVQDLSNCYFYIFNAALYAHAFMFKVSTVGPPGK